MQPITRCSKLSSIITRNKSTDKIACLTPTGSYNPDMKEPDDLVTFRTHVYLIVQQVPPGRVTTYGQVAAMIPPPAGVEPPRYARIRARWVGRAMHNAPNETPWHRVINSQGRISLPAGSRSAAIQRIRLEAENITFDRNGAVDFNRFGWEGPSSLWAEEHGLLSARPLSNTKPIQLPLLPPDEQS